MNYEADDLLEMVDQWKFKLYDRLKEITAKERAAFWKQSAERRARWACWVEPGKPAKRPAKLCGERAKLFLGGME